MPGERRILYADADRESCLLMRDLLAPYRVDVAAADEQALSLAREHNYDLYILTGGPASSGLDLCARLSRIDARTPIVYCSSDATARHQKAAIAAGALRYLVKPVDPTVLRSTVSLLMKLAELESTRALAFVRQVVREQVVHQSLRTRHTAPAAADAKLIERRIRARAYRAFRAAGGNRANFERLWADAFDETKSGRR